MRETIVGIIFFAAIGALAFFTIIVKEGPGGEFTITGSRGTPSVRKEGQLVVHFKSVGKLEVGHKVAANGMDVGKVEDMGFVQEGPDKGLIRVVLTTWSDVPVTEDSTVLIKDVSPLGGKYVDIQIPRGGEPYDDSKPLRGQVQGNLLAEGGDAIAELRVDLKATLDEIRDTFANLSEITGNIKDGKGGLGKIYADDEVGTNLVDTIRELKAFAVKLNDENGTVHALLTERTMYDKLEKAVDNINGLVADVRDGKGSAGKLFTDDTLHDELVDTVKEIKKLVTGITSGEAGTLGKLYSDDTLFTNLNEAVVEIKQLAKDARDPNKGTLGKLLNDTSLHDDLKRITTNLVAVTEGRGTLGKLMTDDTLYNDLTKVIGELGKSIEDTREQAPITTFTNVIFNVF